MREQERTKNHEPFTEMMSLALDGSLDEESRQQMAEHVTTCAECRQEWEAMQRISGWLASEPVVGPSLAFSSRVQRRLAAEETKRRRLFRGIAVFTGSLSLAAITAITIAAIGLGVAAWYWLGAQAAFQQQSGVVFQVASRLGLLGKGAGMLLVDFLAHYGFAVGATLGLGVTLLAVLWVWLVGRKSRKAHPNGYS